jgi:8-amino-7-oxononanoate synthase
MGTLSKAAGAYGAYACAGAEVIEYLKSTARSLVFSTALPPSVVASAIAALTIMEEEPQHAQAALANARLFSELLGLPTAQSAIVPLVLGEEEKALAASRALEEAGFLVAAIRPPTVPPGTARLRFTFSALHARDQVEAVAKLVEGWRCAPPA